MVPPPSAVAAKARAINAGGGNTIKDKAIAKFAAQALEFFIFSASAR
jgi:hypothetical protein